ncbi:uncharacterized protein LOC144886763 isoform X2 [Branchiostoma floridae x Branchiostoma japonicum]
MIAPHRTPSFARPYHVLDVGAPVGCMGWALRHSRLGAAECFVDKVCVTAEYRGRGIGNALVGRAETAARQRGCTTMSLYVRRNNRAVRLYERHGYVITHSFGGCFTQCATGTRDWYNMEKQL